MDSRRSGALAREAGPVGSLHPWAKANSRVWSTPRMRDPERMTTVVVLGCKVGPSGHLSGAAARRVARAVEVVRGLSGAARVICSGGRAWGGAVEADAFAAAVVRLGVPERQVVRERCSMTTIDNARYVAALTERRGAHGEAPGSVVLVTCDWHMPRARTHFANVGLTVVEAPARAPTSARYPGLVAWMRAARERTATLLDEVAR
jgi:uncharacterized SAM-binding protein YcdF (DUF218 family)